MKTMTLPEAYRTYLINVTRTTERKAWAQYRAILAFVRWYKEREENARWSWVTPELIQTYAAHMSDDRLKPKQIRHDLNSLQGIFDWFQKRGLPIKKNPVN